VSTSYRGSQSGTGSTGSRTRVGGGTSSGGTVSQITSSQLLALTLVEGVSVVTSSTDSFSTMGLTVLDISNASSAVQGESNLTHNGGSGG